MKPTVVLVSPAYPYRGGQALVEAHLFHTLSELGYNVRTISFSLLYPRIFFPGKTQYDTSGTTFFQHEEQIERLINSVNPLSWLRAARRIRKLQPVATIFVWWMPFFGPAYSAIAARIKSLPGHKIAFLVENYISHENRWFDKFLSRSTLGRADMFICQSQYIYDQLRMHQSQTPIHKTTLSVYDCYDSGRYDRISAKAALGIRTEKVVLFFGLIRRYKGLDKLIRAFGGIRSRYSDTTLLVVGECYEEIAYYKNLIEQEGISEHTLLIDRFIANEEIEPYFKASDVVVLPYNSASQSGIQMMAYGFQVPVVVNDVGGLAELVVDGKTGRVIENNAPESIARGVIDVFDNADKVDYPAHIRNLNQSLGYKSMDQIVNAFIG